MRRFKWEKHYLYWGVTAFLVVAACIVFFMVINHWGDLREIFRGTGRILAPFAWGLVIAYLLTPIAKRLERLLIRLFRKDTPRKNRLTRAASVVLTVLVTLLVVTLLLINLLPQIYNSIEALVLNLPGYLTEAIDFVQRTLDNALGLAAINLLEQGEPLLNNWVSETLLPNIDVIIISMTMGFFEFVRVLFNLLVGMVLSVYIMYNRERFGAQIKKLLYSLMSEKRVGLALHGVRYVERAFGRFFLGRVLDSLFVGTVTFIFLSVMQMPYIALITVVVAITNTVPFVGPFIGGIPAALLILMENPLQGLFFIIFIIVLQQISGNIVGPRVMASVTGLSGFWVLFSILVGGGLFGFAGMLLGVPVFSLIYDGIGYLMDRRLARRQLPTETEAYTAGAPPGGVEAESPGE